MYTFSSCSCRDKQALDDWREQTKLLRQQKQQFAAMKGSMPGEFFVVQLKNPFLFQKDVTCLINSYNLGQKG